MNQLRDNPNMESVHVTEYGIPIRNIWHMLLYAWGDTPLTNLVSGDDIEESPSLDALLALILIKFVHQRLRIGLGRSYTSEKHTLKYIRGQIKFPDSIKQQSFERGQAVCQFEPYSLNVLKNQIIRSTLMRLVQVGQFGADDNMARALRHRLRWTTRAMSGIDFIDLQMDNIRRLQVSRNDRDYMIMLKICELILIKNIPKDSSGNIRLPALDRDALVMADIYEKFVAKFYQMKLDGWTISPQKYLFWHEETPNNYLPRMKPDLVLQDRFSRNMIVLDTKFTKNSLIKSRWGVETFNSAHLYQIYTYIRTQEHLSPHHKHAIGILLYPTVNNSQLSEWIRIQDLTLRIESINLTDPWQEIEKNLIEIILSTNNNEAARKIIAA